MRDIFRWDRTTINFYRYVSVRAEPLDKILGGEAYHYVIYVPRSGGPEEPEPKEASFIISRMRVVDLMLKPYGEPVAERVQCCSRDNDRDGNCDIHSAPGVMRQTPKRESNIVHRLNTVEATKVETAFFLRTLDELEQKIKDLQFAQNILFKAVYWLLRHIGIVK